MSKITRQVITSYEEEIPNTLEKFKSWVFSSGGTTGEDFKVFARAFRSYVKKNLPPNSILVSFNTGHYYISGFVKRGDKYVYFSISDVRHFSGSWIDDILIRTAKHEKDYTGGCNNSTTLEKFSLNVEQLLER